MLTDPLTDVVLTELLDALPDAVIWMRAVRDGANRVINFRIEYANQKAQEMGKGAYQLSTGTLILDDSDHEQTESEQSFQSMCTVLETNHPYEFSYFNSHINSWLWVNRAKFGDGILSVTRNESALRTAKQAVEQQADLLNSALNGSMNGIMAFAAVREPTGSIRDFTCLSANKASCQIIRRSAQELIGNSLLASFPYLAEGSIFGNCVHVTETGESVHTELTYVRDSQTIWIDISIQKLSDGFVVTFLDTSAVKKATAAAEQSADLLRTVIDSAQVAVYLMNPVWDEAGQLVDFRFRMANQLLASYVGLESGALTGELVSRWFPAYKDNGLFSRYKVIYETDRTLHFNFHYQTDRVDVWLNITGTKLGDDVLITFSDYTSLKQLQQLLESSVADLQRSNKNLEQFAYVASHDLQEPLRKIQQFGDILQAQYTPLIGDSGADIVGRMQSAAARMQVLIKDVLAYSRIAAKRETVVPVDLNQVMHDVLTDIETAISEKHATLTVGTLPTVRGDAAQLRQLFQNLVSNALKFTKHDQVTLPVITVSSQQVVGRNLPGVTLPSADADRAFYLLEVTDNGIGFDPRQAERIFQVFQRLHNRSEYQGTGIGLAIVQKVVANHRGYIVAEGRPGEGATFRVALPID